MKKTIYLVEDDEDIRDMLGLILNRSYHVVPCENLKEFNTQMNQSLPDLVIMDIMLPDGNGDEAGLALQHNAVTKDIPVLFMSANMRFELANPLNKHSFIGKPFDIKFFQQKVNHMISLQ